MDRERENREADMQRYEGPANIKMMPNLIHDYFLNSRYLGCLFTPLNEAIKDKSGRLDYLKGKPRLVDPQKNVGNNRNSDIKTKGAHERAMDFLCFFVGQIRSHVGAISISHSCISVYLHWSEDRIVLDGTRA